MIAPSRHIAIEGTHNIRDLGGYLTARGTAIPQRRFLRADCLHRLGPGGTDLLIGEGLRCVIRSAHEGRNRRCPVTFKAWRQLNTSTCRSLMICLPRHWRAWMRGTPIRLCRSTFQPSIRAVRQCAIS